MKSSLDLAQALNDMFSEDEKKRLSAIKMMNDVASALGPQRTRNQLVPFLKQFVNEEPVIMLAVVAEMKNLLPLLGGPQYQKQFLPLLIEFCSVDEKQIAMSAVELMQKILAKDPDQYIQTLRKMGRIDMDLIRECLVILIASGAAQAPHLEPTFLEFYKKLVFSDSPAVRIIAAKHLASFSRNIQSKEQILKMLQIFYGDFEDLPKLITLELLISMVPLNTNFIMNKVKSLICQNKWRINLRMCQCAHVFGTFFSRSHFKLLMEPAFLKMLTSDDIQIRAAACASLPSLSKNMSEEENQTKLLPLLLSLSNDKIDIVKNEFGKNLVKVLPYFSKQAIQKQLLPLIITILKQSELEVASGILEDFKELSKHLELSKFEQFVLKPLLGHLSSDDWRLKIKTLNLLAKIVLQSKLLTPSMVDLFMSEVKDRIESTRAAACTIIVDILKNYPSSWSQTEIIPKLMKLREHPSYLIRQKMLIIIENSTEHVNDNIIDEYRKTLAIMLGDRVANIRMIALKLASSHSRLSSKLVCNQLLKLREDPDLQIRQAVK